MNPLLEVRHLSISFHTYRGLLEAVHDVSLTVRAGETVGIVGESGCGKSVTSQAVMKLLPQGSAEYRNGEILWEGRDLLPLSESEMNGLRAAYGYDFSGSHDIPQSGSHHWGPAL